MPTQLICDLGSTARDFTAEALARPAAATRGVRAAGTSACAPAPGASCPFPGAAQSTRRRRAKTAGWLVGYEPRLEVRHVWGASTGQDPAESARRHARALSLYLRKHHPRRRLANATLALAMRVGVLWQRQRTAAGS